MVAAVGTPKIGFFDGTGSCGTGASWGGSALTTEPPSIPKAEALKMYRRVFF